MPPPNPPPQAGEGFNSPSPAPAGEGRGGGSAPPHLHATAVAPAGTWDLATASGSVTLAWDARHRRRILLTTDQGHALLLDLPHATRLAEGDGLVLADGGILRVTAKPEMVVEIRAGCAGLTRLAYHLGNRHLPVQLLADALVIRDDPVIVMMVEGLGGIATRDERPFTPEAGAYGSGHRHDHD